MFKLVVDGKNLAIAFAHPVVKDASEGRASRKTQCIIFEFLDNKAARIAGKSEARTNPFNKAVGRKWALKRAICHHTFNMTTKRCKKCNAVYNSFCMRLTKEQREAFWQAYFNRSVKEPVAPKVLEGVVVPEITDGGIVVGPSARGARPSDPYDAVPPENKNGTYHAGA